jgi:sporulation integral membrane protein YtvI
MQAFYEKHKPRIHRIAFFAGCLMFVFLFVKVLFVYVSPFFFGLLIYLIVNPLVELLTSRAKLKRWLATIIGLVVFMALIGGIGTWLVRTLLTQAGEFVKAAPQYAAQISAVMADWQSRLPDFFAEINIQETLLSALPGVFGDGLMDQSRRIVTNAPNFFIAVILSMVSAFFLIKDKKLIFGTLNRHCPEWVKENLITMRNGLSRAVSGYFRAQGILMSITGIIAIGGLLILRSPYALILGLLLAFLDFLPFFGTGFVLIPWAAFSLATAEYGRAIGLVIIYGTVFVMRQILEPKVLSEQIGVYPLVTLMAIFIGYRLFGFVGIFVGPALVMMFIAMEKKVNL